MATSWQEKAPGAGVRRVADVQLRGMAGPLWARVYWPAPTGVPPAVMVFFGAGEAAGAGVGPVDALCRELCSGVGLVVLSTVHRPADQPYPAAVRDAATATEWVADHAAELDADPGRLVVAGLGSGGDLAAAVALHARDHGWPPITRQLLIYPRLGVPRSTDPADHVARLPSRSLAGVAPATVVSSAGGPVRGDGRRSAARLRRAGVEVEELRYDGAADAAGQMLADLVRALRRAVEDGPGRPMTPPGPA
jgi:acetyl esterase